MALVQRLRPGQMVGQCSSELSIGEGALEIDAKQLNVLLTEMVERALSP